MERLHPDPECRYPRRPFVAPIDRQRSVSDPEKQ
jgi:hypothetical protein